MNTATNELSIQVLVWVNQKLREEAERRASQQPQSLLQFLRAAAATISSALPLALSRAC